MEGTGGGTGLTVSRCFEGGARTCLKMHVHIVRLLQQPEAQLTPFEQLHHHSWCKDVCHVA